MNELSKSKSLTINEKISKSSYLAYRCNSRMTKAIKIVDRVCSVNLSNVNFLFVRLSQWLSTNHKINRCDMWTSIFKCETVSLMINSTWSCLKWSINIIFTSLYLNWTCCQTIFRERLLIINERRFFWKTLNLIRNHAMLRNWCQLIAFCDWKLLRSINICKIVRIRISDSRCVLWLFCSHRIYLYMIASFNMS